MKKKEGRPTKYNIDYNEQVEKLCKLGATDKEIATFFNVAESTINLWKLKEPEFSESLKAGKEIADMTVSDSLFQRAKGYEHDDIHFSSYEGAVTQTPYTKYYPPDPTSMIFWLKNRQFAKWRDKQNVEHTGTIGMSDAKALLGDAFEVIGEEKKKKPKKKKAKKGKSNDKKQSCETGTAEGSEPVDNDV